MRLAPSAAAPREFQPKNNEELAKELKRTVTEKKKHRRIDQVRINREYNRVMDQLHDQMIPISHDEL